MLNSVTCHRLTRINRTSNPSVLGWRARVSFRQGLLEGFALSGIAAIAVAWLFSRYPSIIPLWYILALIIYAVVALVTYVYIVILRQRFDR